MRMRFCWVTSPAVLFLASAVLGKRAKSPIVHLRVQRAHLQGNRRRNRHSPMWKTKAKKLDAVFHIHLHNIEPWPSGIAVHALQVHWARGSSRNGVTQPARLQRTAYVFEETIVVPCTLQQVHRRASCGYTQHLTALILHTETTCCSSVLRAFRNGPHRVGSDHHHHHHHGHTRVMQQSLVETFAGYRPPPRPWQQRSANSPCMPMMRTSSTHTKYRTSQPSRAARRRRTGATAPSGAYWRSRRSAAAREVPSAKSRWGASCWTCPSSRTPSAGRRSTASRSAARRTWRPLQGPFRRACSSLSGAWIRQRIADHLREQLDCLRHSLLCGPTTWCDVDVAGASMHQARAQQHALLTKLPCLCPPAA